MTTKDNSKVGVVMGSVSDWPIMSHTSDVLNHLDIPHVIEVVSAHRTPLRLYEYGREAQQRGLKVIIAGAGGAAHLPGMIASLTTLPVCGVPIPSTDLKGLDSLYSIVQMPQGVPVATFAIGIPGAKNAAYFAAAILGVGDEKLQERIKNIRHQQSQAVPLTPPLT